MVARYLYCDLKLVKRANILHQHGYHKFMRHLLQRKRRVVSKRQTLARRPPAAPCPSTRFVSGRIWPGAGSLLCTGPSRTSPTDGHVLASVLDAKL